MPKLSLDFCSAPIVVHGVLVCNDNAEGLIGLDAGTGQRLWGPVPQCIRKTSSPVVWRHQGKGYVVSALDKAICLDPRTGNVLWEHAEDVSNGGTLAIGGDYMVTGGGGKGRTGIACLKLSLAGATRVWNRPECGLHVTSPLIHNGHVYGWMGAGAAACVELETGKLAGTADFYSVRTCSSFIGADGRVVRPHLYSKLLLYDADPKAFRQLGEPWVAPSYAECTTPAISDGRLFFRGKDCVYCYDLRAAAQR